MKTGYGFARCEGGKSTKKRVMATMMASVLTLASISSCSKTTDVDSPATTQAAATTTAATTAAETTTAAQSGQTWEDGQVITWLVRDKLVTDNWTRYADLLAVDRLEEELNVKIEFEGLWDDEILLARLTGGKLPDIISWKWNDFYSEKGGIPGLYADGVCIDLTEMIENGMPNLKAIFEEYPNIRRDMASDDGKYLYLMRINPKQTPEQLMGASTSGIVIRQDWLDNVSMEAPSDIAEWYDVLTAFKTMDPNGNGDQDEIPFDASSGGIQYFEGAFGMSSQQYIDPETGKVEYGARTQNYKAYLQEMNKWYSEGLVGNLYTEEGVAIASSDPGGSDETIIADLVGSWKGLANNNTKWTPTLIEKNPSASIAAVQWPEASDGVSYSGNNAAATVASETIIVTSDCECTDAVAAVFNWMLSDEGSQLLTWGEEGDSFEYLEDGSRSLIIDPDTGIQKRSQYPIGNNVDYYKLYGNESSYLPSFGYYDIHVATKDDWYKSACETWSVADFSLFYPKAITLSTEQAEKVSEVTNTELFAYIEEMKWKFITGQEPLSGYDTYVANLERMGLSDIVAVYQQAYDNYMAK